MLGYGCGSKSASSTAGVSGEFTGTAKGMGGDVTVTLTLTDGKITGCTAEGKDETPGIGTMARFVGVACAVKNFKGMRVAQVGMRPKPFCSVIFNESDLMDKFDIHVIPVNLAVTQDKYRRILETRKDELAEGVAKLRQM